MLFALQPVSAGAAANVVVGPTPIVDGEAAAARDITVFNEHLAFGLAVESVVPYGVPRGAIVDVAPVVDGKPGRDRVVFADFIPNNWSAWPNTYQKVEIVDRGPAQVMVQATRDWDKVTIVTTYTLRANADRVEIRTTMTNTGNTPLSNLLSGQTLWPSAGYFFGIPGLEDLKEGADRERSPIGSWPMTRTGRLRCTRRTSITWARDRSTCSVSTHSDPANREYSTHGCKSAHAAILARRSPPRSIASISIPATCTAS